MRSDETTGVRVRRTERGQDVVEYSLLLILIAAVCVVGMTLMGKSVQSLFDRVDTRLSTVNEKAGEEK